MRMERQARDCLVVQQQQWHKLLGVCSLRCQQRQMVVVMSLLQQVEVVKAVCIPSQMAHPCTKRLLGALCG
jgi:hypothetical protein